MNKQDLINELTRKVAYAEYQVEKQVLLKCKEMQDWWEGRLSAFSLALMMAEDLDG